jgi:hypothetical protein
LIFQKKICPLYGSPSFGDELGIKDKFRVKEKVTLRISPLTKVGMIEIYSLIV